MAPEAGKVDVGFLKKFRDLILKRLRQGDCFAITVGGGKLCRVWQEAAKELGVAGVTELDWVGIRATQLNAELVRVMFGAQAYPQVVVDPQKPVKNFKVVIGAGFLPGHSSDYDTVVRAKTIGAKTVINLSNVTYIYDKDPNKYKDAQPLKKLSWDEYLQMFGRDWQPGANVPFDQKTAQLAKASKITAVSMNGRDLKNLDNYFNRRSFDGTVVGIDKN